ncbi:MAG TPA: hypothetical protein VMJ10_35280 [Kofleriaceae bacterium]|nr:hypothetical protein [Kofleriaceae bacterium]
MRALCVGLISAFAISLAPAAHADEIPIITLTEYGPDQQIPTYQSFFVAGDVAPTVDNVQAIVVRKGSSSLFGDDGDDCHSLVSGLHVASTTRSADAEDADELADDDRALRVRYPAGVHKVFELFPTARQDLRDSDVLVTAAWQRSDDNARRYKVLVPHDREYLSAGYGFCLFVVATERAQAIDDTTLNDLADLVARRFVGCGDKSSCDDDALADYEARAARELARARSTTHGSVTSAHAIAALLKEAARSELASATGIIEARDRVQDHWNDQERVMSPLAEVVWADTATDPFAHALATMLARSAALLPQVRTGSVALFTTDGRLQVNALRVLDDGRSIRVATSKTPSGDQARVLTATTDTLAIADGLTLYDLIQLGNGRVRVDKDWITLPELGERLSGLGLDAWTPDDTAYLTAAAAQLRRLTEYVDDATSGAQCPHGTLASTEAEQTADAVRRHLGEWLVCQHADVRALESLSQQLDDLEREDRAWKETRDELVAREKQIVTLTTTAPIAARVEFTSTTWVFSYVTPFVGYAAVVQPDESFGLFYVGAQIHLAPNPVDDPLWRDGVTTRDLSRAVALELGVAPYGGSFGPNNRYSGPGSLPPLFAGIAVHVVPYTSLTFGGSFVDRKDSPIPQEQAHLAFAPYFGFTVSLNLFDLVRQASHPGSDTTAYR